MLELHPDSQAGIFRTILEFENRCEQLEEIVAHLKHGFISDPTAVSVPDLIGTLDEIRWHLNQTLSHVEVFQGYLGVRRKVVQSQAPTRRRGRPNDLRGSTNTLSIPDLLSMLGTQMKTGTLWIKSPDEVFALELVEGAVVHAMTDTPRPEQRLGMILVAQNRISVDKLDQFLADYDAKDGKIGEALARSELISETDLRDALQRQARDLFERIAGLDSALFCFREGAVSDLEKRVCLNTTQLLAEAARRAAEFEAAAADVTPESASVADEELTSSDDTNDDGHDASAGDTCSTGTADTTATSAPADPTSTTH